MKKVVMKEITELYCDICSKQLGNCTISTNKITGKETHLCTYPCVDKFYESLKKKQVA